jgi:hypothetical protein
VVLAASLTTAARTIHKVVLNVPVGGGAADGVLFCVWPESLTTVAAYRGSVHEPIQTAPHYTLSRDDELDAAVPLSPQQLKPRDRLRWLVLQLE